MRKYRYPGGLLFLFVLLINGCAGLSVEVDSLDKYPPASKPPIMDGVCSEVKLPNYDVLNEIRVGFATMGGMRVNDSGSGKVADVCSELSRKAQNAGAQIVVVRERSLRFKQEPTSVWQGDRSGGGYWIIGAGPTKLTQEYTWDAALWVYDPDKNKAGYLSLIENNLTYIEQRKDIPRNDFFNFSDVRTYVKQGRYSEALEKVKRTKRYAEDSKLSSLIVTLNTVIKSIEYLIIFPSLTKDPEAALRQYIEKRAALGKVSP